MDAGRAAVREYAGQPGGRAGPKEDLSGEDGPRGRASPQVFRSSLGREYPTIAKMWRVKWTDIITLFDYPPATRKVIYTTNAIESVNQPAFVLLRRHCDATDRTVFRHTDQSLL
jgi:hypothetical protein